MLWNGQLSQMLKIDTIHSLRDVEICVDMYMQYNDDTFMLAERDVALKQITLIARRQKFFRVLKEDGVIVACLIADTACNHHSSVRMIAQQYYASNQTGVKAFKCIKLLHEELFKYAEETKHELVASAGSHFDPDNTFARILEKLGWQRRHYLCVKRTSHHRDS